MRSLCSVILGKSGVGEPAHKLPSYNDMYYAFGYYDYIYLRRIDVQKTEDEQISDPRLLAQEFAGKYSFRHLMLYFDSDNPKYIQAYNTFWNANNPIFCISFIHRIQSYVPQQSAMDQQKKIEKQIYESLIDTTDFHFVCLRSAALSDCVVLWRTNSIRDILKSLEAIYKINDIGYTWSICGIDITQPENSLSDDVLSHLSIRIIQRNAKGIKQVLNEIDTILDKKEESRQNNIIGSENLIVIYENIKQQALIPLLTKIQGNATLGESIYSIDTQVGNKEEEVNKWEKSPLHNPIELKLISLLEIFWSFYNEVNTKQYPWLHSVHDLINQSIRMSKSFVTDEVCNITYDSLELFVYLLQRIISEEELLGDTDSEVWIEEKKNGLSLHRIEDKEAGIHAFIRGYQLFLEQIVKIDGPIFKEPGYHHVLYDVPAKLINYYSCFCKHIIDICKALENQPKTKTSFLIVPKLCRQIKVVNILRISQPCDNLLIIELPYSDIYHPQKVMITLAHEIMHFSGDSFRCRDRRRECFIKLWTYQIGDLIDIPYDKMESKKVLQTIRERLTKETASAFERAESPIPYGLRDFMCYTSQAISEAVMGNFFANKEIFVDCVKYLIGPNAKYVDIKRHPEYGVIWKKYLQKCTYDGMISLYTIHEDFGKLINDCFSDWSVCMMIEDIYPEYVKRLFVSDRKNFSNMNSKQRVHALIRASVITIAIKNEYDTANFEKLNRLIETGDNSISKVVEFIKCFTSRKSGNDNLAVKFITENEIDIKDVYPFQIVIKLVEYLKYCNEKAKLIDEKAKEELKKMWVDSSAFCSDSFLAHLFI